MKMKSKSIPSTEPQADSRTDDVLDIERNKAKAGHWYWVKSVKVGGDPGAVPIQQGRGESYSEEDIIT